MAPAALTEREIGGRVWVTDTFGGKESLSLFRQLTVLAAGPISEAAKEVGDQLDGVDVDGPQAILTILGGAAGLAGRMAEKLSDAEFTALAQRLLRATLCRVEGKNVNAGDHMEVLFKGDVATLLQVLAFVVEVNFIGPFSSLIGPAVGSVMARLREAAGSIQAQSSGEKPTQ